jgi:hypothetical protein
VVTKIVELAKAGRRGDDLIEQTLLALEGNETEHRTGMRALEHSVPARVSRPSSRGACPASPEAFGVGARPMDAIVLAEIGAPSAFAENEFFTGVAHHALKPRVT